MILLLLAVAAGVIFVVLDSQNAPTSQPTNEAPPATLPATEVANVPTHTPIPSSPIPPTATTQIDATTASQLNETLPTIPEGAVLFIPSAGIFSNIVQAYLDGTSWDVSRLGTNVGHLQGTPWVANGGNVVLSGHVELADGRQGVFANLDEVALGDVIEITHTDDSWRYIVTEISTTTPQDLTPLLPSTRDRLTLITCDDYSFTLNSYLERTIIVAERIG